MKRLRSTFILAVLAIVIVVQAIPAQAFSVGGYSRIFEGIEYATAYVTSPRTMRAWALRISLRNPDVSTGVTPGNGGNPYETALQTTPAFLSAYGLKCAVNASFFDANLSPNTDIWGLLMSGGNTVSPPDYAAPFNSQLNFTSSKAVSLVTSNSYPAGGYNSIAGAEIILTNGVVGGGSTVLNPHTAMGISSDGKYVILVCIDGRQSGWSDGCGYPETAQFLKDFGAWNGVMMDGGGSTCMSVSGMGSYVNRPCYGYARSVGANFGIYSAAVGTVGPNACCMNVGRTDVITRGNMNHIYLHTWTSAGGWADWVDLGGGTYDSPTIVSRQDGILDCFCRGTDNHLYVKSYNGSWTGWTNLGGDIRSAPAACSRTSSVIDVFARGAGNDIQKITWVSGTGWSTWSSIGGATYDAVGCCAPDSIRVDVFCRATNNALSHNNWTSGVGWSGWASLGGSLTSGPAAESRNANQVDVAYRGSNNHLFTISWTGGVGWSAHYDQGDYLASKPGVCSSASDNFIIFYRGTNDHQYQTSWSASGGWTTPTDQGCYY